MYFCIILYMFFHLVMRCRFDVHLVVIISITLFILYFHDAFIYNFIYVLSSCHAMPFWRSSGSDTFHCVFHIIFLLCIYILFYIRSKISLLKLLRNYSLLDYWFINLSRCKDSMANNLFPDDKFRANNLNI